DGNPAVPRSGPLWLRVGLFPQTARPGRVQGLVYGGVLPWCRVPGLPGGPSGPRGEFPGAGTPAEAVAALRQTAFRDRLFLWILSEPGAPALAGPWLRHFGPALPVRPGGTGTR